MKLKPIYIVIFLIAAVFAIFFLLFRNAPKAQYADGVPQQPIHWHPSLKIIINGQEQIIPTGIGINIGKSTDYEISGMRMSPMHTHESDGTIHLENNRPWQKPETLALGYFFKAWDKNFNSSCIFEYCSNENSILTMTINGKPNYEFDKYIMQDKDEIIIEYRQK